MRLWFFILSLLSLQTPIFCDFKPYILEKKIKLDEKLLISAQNNTLVFDWLNHTKTALIHVDNHHDKQEWWFVFNSIPKGLFFPDEHDLPVGVLSLRQELDTSVKKSNLIIKITINEQFTLSVTKNNTMWSIEVIPKDNKQSKNTATLNTKSWPNTTYPCAKNDNPYALNINQPEKSRYLTCFLMDNVTDNIGSYETPFYKIFDSIQGGGAELFSSDVQLIKQNDCITLSVNTLLKPQKGVEISTTKPLPAQVGIFKNHNTKALLAYANKHQLPKQQSPTPLADQLTKAWVEMMIGNERAMLSFIQDIERNYPGVAHHPFVRALKTTAYIMDTNFIKAQEHSLYLPRTAENILLTALIESAQGANITHKSKLKVIKDIYKHYTGSIRDEIMGPILIALIDIQDYETLEFLLKNIPVPKTFQFRKYFEYAEIMLTLSKDIAGIKFQQLTDFVEDFKFGKLSPHLQANALFQKVSLDIRSGAISTKEAVKQLVSLSYMWRGDQFEAKTLLKLATLLRDNKQYRQALLYFQRIKDTYIAMYQMMHIHKKMEFCFVNFFKDNIKTSSPLHIVSFYERYKEYTPNSSAEADIIQTVATVLMDLDLLEQSAALLTAATKNKNSPHFLVAFYLSAAQLHVKNQKGDLALSTLNKIPQSGLDEHGDKIRLIKARAHASIKNINTALKVLDEKSTIDGLKLAADLLIEQHDWEGARKRLFQLILQLDNTEHKEMKVDALNWIAMLNILTDRIYDNKALAFVNKKFINEQPENMRRTFDLLTNDKEMQIMSRDAVEEQLNDEGINQFFETYMKKKK